MRTFLNVPILDVLIKCLHIIVVSFRLQKNTMFPYSEQVQNCELYDTSVGDDLDAK